MRPTAVVVAIFAACTIFPTASVAAPAKCRNYELRMTYVVNYRHVARVFGSTAPGFDVHRTRGCRAIARSIRTFRRWLNDPRASATRRDRTPTRGRTSPRSTGGLYAIPAYIVWRESRGSYFARNPSGAFGAYQLMPFHFHGGGECAGLGTGPAGQDACAAILWRGGAGSAHWAATR